MCRPATCRASSGARALRSERSAFYRERETRGEGSTGGSGAENGRGQRETSRGGAARDLRLPALDLNSALRSSAPEKGAVMNKDILAGKWKEMKGRVKEQWGKLTDDELDRAEGKADQLVGLLQQRYGYTREKAQEEYDRFLQRQDTEVRR